MTEPRPDASASDAGGDTELVALVHGELDAAAAAALRARLLREPDLRARHDALLAADRALREALDTGEVIAVRVARWLRPLLGVAAFAIVVLVIAFGPTGERAAGRNAGRNDWVELRAAPHGGASHPLFTDVALDLHWRKVIADDGARWLEIEPFPFGVTAASVAGQVAARSVEVAGKFVPLVVTATLRAPDGSAVEARLCPQQGAHVDGSGTVVQTVLLRDFEVVQQGPLPYLGGAPTKDGWTDDFMWVYREMPKDRQRRWFPEQPGEWRIDLRVEALPPPQAGRWPVFAAPLLVQTAVVLTADVSAWGEPHDGLRARVVCASGCPDAEHAPIAIQIENRSGRGRRYNVTGTTLAKIPQPFHFEMWLGDTACTQRGGLPVVTAAEDEMMLHPDGTVRTLVFDADCFRCGGERVMAHAQAQRTPVELRMRFHFEPTLWVGGDAELWMGELRTGALQLGKR
jgi:hypothetical protein